MGKPWLKIGSRVHLKSDVSSDGKIITSHGKGNWTVAWEHSGVQSCHLSFEFMIQVVDKSKKKKYGESITWTYRKGGSFIRDDFPAVPGPAGTAPLRIHSRRFVCLKKERIVLVCKIPVRGHLLLWDSGYIIGLWIPQSWLEAQLRIHYIHFFHFFLNLVF